MRTLLTALVVVLATPALADLTVVTEVTSAGKKRVVTVSLKGQRSFMSLEEDGKSPPTIVRDGAAKQMFIIDHKNKTVVKAVEPNDEELKLRQEQFKQQMAAQLARLPPEQRKKMEERLFPAPNAPVTPLTYEKKKTPARKVNGFSCEDYVIKREGQVAGEGCFAPFKDFKFTAAEYQDAFKAALPKAAMPGQQQNFEADQLAPGIAVLRTLVDAQGNVTSETTLKSLTKTALAADKFEVPKDYTVKSAPDLMPPTAPPPAPTK
jgi:hypothetical protein